MKRTAILAVTAGVCTAAVVFHPTPEPPTALERMTNAAEVFLGALSADQRAKAVFAFDAEERTNWHFVPRTYPGLAFAEMNSNQRRAAHALMRSVLSSRGYLKVTAIFALEQVLFDLESKPGKPARHRNPERYWFGFFGSPSLQSPWGWRVQGHHVSLNWTSVKSELAVTPAFLGANPAEVREGPFTGLRVLGEEADLARELLELFDAEQRGRVLLEGRAPRDVILGPGRERELLGAPKGLAAADMNDPQRGKLVELIEEYARNLRREVADVEMRRIHAAGIEQVHFAWCGGTGPQQPHYYRVHGPGFVIEYDNTQNGANHAHTVWHDFQNGFGVDALRRHYERGHK